MSDNQVIERLLGAGGGEAHAFSGFLSTGREEHIRLYQALSTEAYIELAQEHVLHIEEPDKDNGEAIVYVNSDAHVRLVFERDLTVRDIRPEPERPAASPPDQPSRAGLTATPPGGLTVCAGGLTVILCAHPVVGPYGHIHWAYKLGTVYVTCGPGGTYVVFC